MTILIITQAPRQGTESYGNELNNCGSPRYTEKEGEGGALERQNDRNNLITPGEALWMELCKYLRGHMRDAD